MNDYVRYIFGCMTYLNELWNSADLMVQILASYESNRPIHYYDHMYILSWQPEHLEKKNSIRKCLLVSATEVNESLFYADGSQ
jgi:hypothetical protein